jgi:hypothetical protein
MLKANQKAQEIRDTRPFYQTQRWPGERIAL